MNRRALATYAIVALWVSGCGQAPRDPEPVTQTSSDAKRGNHRVRQSSRRNTQEVATVSDVDIPMLDMDLLDKEPSSFEVDRDPFRYGRVQPPKVAAPPPAEKKAPRPVVERPQDTGPIIPVPEPFRHTYLGSFGSAGLRIAVFQDSEGTIINAFEGEVLDSKFKVLKIGYESVDIEFVGFPDTPPERRLIGG